MRLIILFIFIKIISISFAVIPVIANSLDPLKISQYRKTNPVIIVLLGMPGAGKGTFAQILQSENFKHFSIGEYLRDEAKNNTKLGNEWKQEIKEHGILSCEVVKKVTSKLLKKIDQDNPDVYIFDGHIRKLEQAQHLEKLLQGTNILSFYVYIKTDKNIALSRMLSRLTCKQCKQIYNLQTNPPKKKQKCDLCGNALDVRNTDNKAQTINRFNLYKPHLDQTVAYYKSANKLLEVDGNKDLDDYVCSVKKIFGIKKYSDNFKEQKMNLQ